MSCLYLTVEIELCQPIENACYDAVALAKRMGINVRFRFNGIHLCATPSTDPEKLIPVWEKSLEGK